MYAAKVNLKQLDIKYWAKTGSTHHEAIYKAEVYCVTLKRTVHVVHYRDKRKDNYAIFLSTDTIYDLSHSVEQSGVFSIQNIKRIKQNQRITDFIFVTFSLDLTCTKIKQLYQRGIDYGKLVA